MTSSWCYGFNRGDRCTNTWTAVRDVYHHFSALNRIDCGHSLGFKTAKDDESKKRKSSSEKKEEQDKKQFYDTPKKEVPKAEEIESFVLDMQYLRSIN